MLFELISTACFAVVSCEAKVLGVPLSQESFTVCLLRLQNAVMCK